ncbi:UNVERIFIED_ORG: hypothetical protein J2X79_004635 [Arthrobacter globiformis]|nr:hypothetical protein [Arthrobacter globiformis]
MLRNAGHGALPQNGTRRNRLGPVATLH